MTREIPAFQQTQYRLSRFLRNPGQEEPPEGIEERRLNIYRDLIYNNIESFIRSGFPVLHSLYQEDEWRKLVRSFIADHRCRTPYFLEISQEFLHFLQARFMEPPADKPFLLELAHYEWVELALSVAIEQVPGTAAIDRQGLLETPLSVSPLAWRLSYQYPVHRIGPENQPLEPPEQPTFLVVHRNFADRVKFMEVNAVTSRLIQLFEEGGSITGETGLKLIAEELGKPYEQLKGFGLELLEELFQSDILYRSSNND